MRIRKFWMFFLFLVLALSEVHAQEAAKLASIYYWKTKPGKLDEYNRYIKSAAEPIDEEARKVGAFISMMTFLSQQDSSAWTHMRVFLLRDSVQLQNLTRLLDEAAIRLEPDETRRKRRAEYAATLRDFVAHEIVQILK